MNNNDITLDLKPSGFNSQFQGEHLEFKDYIAGMQKIITQSRVDLTPDKKSVIVSANSPFIMEPPAGIKPKAGILLIHGLFDSPFYLRDAGEYFASQGYLVKAILLPGHGTVPGDLLEIHYSEWIKAVNYGIKSLAQDVAEIYLLGYSLGGILALQQILMGDQTNSIKGLILLAPAIKPKSHIKNFLVKHHRIFSWVHPLAKWFQLRPRDNFAKYNSYSFNAGYQACDLINQVQKALRTTSISIPLFIVMSSEDETVCNKAIITFFKRQPNKKNELLIYSKEGSSPHITDARIIIKSSVYPEFRIVDFSHSCLTISPQNPYLGNTSNYTDLNHYANSDLKQKNNLTLGAVTKANIKNFTLSRLSYNPDFDDLMSMIRDFMLNTE